MLATWAGDAETVLLDLGAGGGIRSAASVGVRTGTDEALGNGGLDFGGTADAVEVKNLPYSVSLGIV